MAPVPVGHDRARVERRSITRVLERASSSRRLNSSRECVHRVELESLSSQVRILKVVKRDGGTLLLNRGGSRDVSVYQLVELRGTQSREELQLSTKNRLEDGKSLRKSVRVGRHDKLRNSGQVVLIRRNSEGRNRVGVTVHSPSPVSDEAVSGYVDGSDLLTLT